MNKIFILGILPALLEVDTADSAYTVGSAYLDSCLPECSYLDC